MNTEINDSLRGRFDVTGWHERRLTHNVEKRTVRGSGAAEQPNADELVERDAQMERQRDRLGVQMCKPQVESSWEHVHQEACTPMVKSLSRGQPRAM